MLDPPFADDFFFDFRTWKKKKRRKKGHILKYSCSINEIIICRKIPYEFIN